MVDTIMQLIGSYGFPIIMCLLMYKTMNDNNERHEHQISNLNDKHKEEMTELTTAVNNNTNVMNLILQKLGGEN